MAGPGGIFLNPMPWPPRVGEDITKNNSFVNELERKFGGRNINVIISEATKVALGILKADMANGKLLNALNKSERIPQVNKVKQDVISSLLKK